MATDYYKRPDETTAQFNTRIQQYSTPLTSESLAPTEGLTLPEQPTPTDNRPLVDGTIAGIQSQFDALTQQQGKKEGELGDIGTQLLDLTKQLDGETQKKVQLEQAAGIPGQRTELQGVINRLQSLSKQAAAIPLQIQQESIGRGRTAGGVAPIETARLRDNAIESLGLAAIGQTLQGNITLAQQTITDALNAEFEPKRLELDILRETYTQNKDALERIDRNKTSALGFLLTERSRLLDIEETERKEVYDIAKTAGMFGAGVEIMQRIQNARTPQEALQEASGFLSDPLQRKQMEQQLANGHLQAELTNAQIQRQYQEIELFNEFGGLSPAEYRKMLKEEKAEIEAAEEETEKAKLQAEAIGKKINLLNGLYNPDTGTTAAGFGTVVGPTLFARGGQRHDAGFILGTIRGLGTVTSLGIGISTGGALWDEATGSADNIVNIVEQFISQEFLQNLIDVKAQGATFGALQKAEQDALTAAATKIGNARIRDGKTETSKVIGYDMAEKDFKQEWATLRFYANLAHERAVGKTFLPDEQKILDAYEESLNMTSGSFNPALFFQQ